MTAQLQPRRAPLKHRSLGAPDRRAEYFQTLREDNPTDGTDPRRGGLELDAPYQRGDVWSASDRRLLIKSFLLGLPVPAVITNNRFAAGWIDPDGERDYRLAVVDGKQRVTTLLMWLDDELTLPAWWIPQDDVANTSDEVDGEPHVRRGDLTGTGERILRGRLKLPVAEAQLTTLQEEAELYLLLNRGGVEHTAADLKKAADLLGR